VSREWRRRGGGEQLAEHAGGADVVEQVVGLAALADRAGLAVGPVEVGDVEAQDLLGAGGRSWQLMLGMQRIADVLQPRSAPHDPTTAADPAATPSGYGSPTPVELLADLAYRGRLVVGAAHQAGGCYAARCTGRRLRPAGRTGPVPAHGRGWRRGSGARRAWYPWWPEHPSRGRVWQACRVSCDRRGARLHVDQPGDGSVMSHRIGVAHVIRRTRRQNTSASSTASLF
jgi:hypothetical protein